MSTCLERSFAGLISSPRFKGCCAISGSGSSSPNKLDMLGPRTAVRRSGWGGEESSSSRRSVESGSMARRLVSVALPMPVLEIGLSLCCSIVDNDDLALGSGGRGGGGGRGRRSGLPAFEVTGLGGSNGKEGGGRRGLRSAPWDEWESRVVESGFFL